jgi:hypothetical protein
MSWVNVNDKLPDINKPDGDFKTSESVIARFSNKEGGVWYESVTLKLWCDDDNPEWYYDYDSERVDGNKITHWMEVPEI